MPEGASRGDGASPLSQGFRISPRPVLRESGVVLAAMAVPSCRLPRRSLPAVGFGWDDARVPSLPPRPMRWVGASANWKDGMHE
jgi:hypothetical protein